jgi:hypothetical protein
MSSAHSRTRQNNEKQKQHREANECGEDEKHDPRSRRLLFGREIPPLFGHGT